MEHLKNKVIAYGYTKTTNAGRGITLNIDMGVFGTLYLNAFPHEKAGETSEEGKPFPYMNLVVYLEDEKGERKSVQVGALWHKVKSGYEFKTGTLDLAALNRVYNKESSKNEVVGAKNITPNLCYDFSDWAPIPVILQDVRGYRREVYIKDESGEGGSWQDKTPQYQLRVMSEKEVSTES